ncbi:ephrin type-B receptor 5 isoform X3 [Cynoglossus semilaevis]|uniref:ephrin type-B receptor 5 isoform X3 n=1 Tax=Cynoglossus semilaevis TaxID=244447 RepID=UPI000D62B288|nr:ephrin type-B receptor 5-like isoform X3 [Cynoglossus semilaevis]
MTSGTGLSLHLLQQRAAAAVRLCSDQPHVLISSFLPPVIILDTTESTAELGWTTYPDTGWDEVSVLDDQGKLIRTFEVCNVNQNPRLQDNWLATPFLYRQSAPRVFVTLRFSVRDCGSLRSPSPTCRETLTLYYKQADSQRALQRSWVTEPSSRDRETKEGWVKIDTIAADKSFSKVEPSSPHQYQPNRYSRINVKTLSFSPLTKNGFVLAVVDSGACVSLMGVTVFYRRCSATSLYLASYPATPSGAEATALVSVTGTCVRNSRAQGGAPPRMHCNAEGEWMVPVGECVCDQGHEPNQNGSACLVPSSVPMMHQLSRAPDSITLSWPQPDRPNGDILEYQLRYYDKGSDEGSSVSVFSETNTITINTLVPGSIYGFQIRARNERGFGPYSSTVYFTTLPLEEQSQQMQTRLPLLVGSVMGGAAFLLVVAAIVVVVVFRRKRRESPYSDRLQRYVSHRGGVKYYVDPSTYEDPGEAVREFAREVDPAHLKVEDVIGPAHFGEVSRGRYRPLGRREVLVAVKTLRWGASDRERGVFLSEAGVLGQFDHPNVLKLEGVVTQTAPVRIITEFMENGPLDAFLRDNEGQFSVLQTVGMLRGICGGMWYLSERNFVHRDLAARNILVNSNLVCKVSDFGLSRLMRGVDHNMPTYTASLGSKVPVRWTAPEAFQHRKFSSASDVWSFGVLMWEVMSYGERPYWDMSNQEVMKAVADQYRLPAPHSCPPALHSLMLQCWQADRGDRPGFDGVLSSLDRLIRHPASLKTEPSR